ncbi:MAG: VOC family protein [Opitutales bacterium]
MSQSNSQKPAFNETMQIAIVVRDLNTTMRNYTDNYGIGPWQVHQFKPEDVKSWEELGQTAEPSTRFATTMVGSVQWELIQPLDDQSIYARFLAEKGEGVHHIAVATHDYDTLMQAEQNRGKALVLKCALGGKYEGLEVAYLGSEAELGVTLEVFNGLPSAVRDEFEQS